jgi:multiple sugar transport system substrate-binding protein
MRLGLSRRRLLGAAGGIVVAGAAAHRPRAAEKTLKILKWSHAIAAYDEWFATFAGEWGERHDTHVLVDRVGFGEIDAQVWAEAERGEGHDLVLFLNPGALLEDQVIDHREIHEECEQRYGRPAGFAVTSTYNPKTAKYFGLCLGYQPTVITYRRDLWDGAGVAPERWGDILAGGRRIRLLHDKPVGLSLAAEHNSEHTLRAILYAFGASEQDETGRPALKSVPTLEALKYVKALYEEAMSEDVLGWSVVSNDQFMLSGDGSLTLDTVNICRVSENAALPIAADLRLAPMPEGPAGRRGPGWGLVTAAIWRFAENVEGAKQFLVDYVGSSRHALLASGFQSLPGWPGAVSNLAEMVAADPGGGISGKYALLAEALGWTTNVGYPGHTNAAISEVFQGGLIPRMFARAAAGEATPEDALAVADGECHRIFEKWQDAGRI